MTSALLSRCAPDGIMMWCATLHAMHMGSLLLAAQ
jgi:hypothetical protein